MFARYVVAASLLVTACSSTPPAPQATVLLPYTAGSEDDPEARSAWYWQQRTYPTGTLPVEAHRAAVRRELDDIRKLDADDLTWESIGPAPLLDVPVGDFSVHQSSGRTLAIALHPTDPKTILLGTAMGGIWKSTDGGRNFYSTGPEQSLSSLAVSVLQFSPRDPNVLYAGTGEATAGLSAYGTGMLRSIDGGETWQQLPARGDGWDFEYVGVTGLQFDARDAETLYITTASVFMGARLFRMPQGPTRTGLFKSTDGGVSWRMMREAVKHPGPTGSVGFFDLEYGGAVAPDLFYLSEYHGGILRSTDRGETFSYVTPRKPNGFGMLPDAVHELPYFDQATGKYMRLRRLPNEPQTYEFRRIEIGMSQSNPQLLFAGVDATVNRLDYNYNGIADSGDRFQPMALLFKSEDGGDSWRWLGSMFDGVPDYCGQQCIYDNVVTVNPTNPDDIILGGMANYRFMQPSPLVDPVTLTELPWRGMVFRSFDGGKTWSDLTPQCSMVSKAPYRFQGSLPVYRCEAEDAATVIHPDIHAITITPEGSIYVATDGGLYRATGRESNPRPGRRRPVNRPLETRWEALNSGLATLQFYRIATHPTNPNIMLGGLQDNTAGYWNGSTWQSWGGGDGTIAVFDPIDPNRLYLGSQYAVHRHLTGGSKAFTQEAGWTFDIFSAAKLKSGEKTTFVPVFELDRKETNIVYGGSDKAIYRSTNRGSSFSRVGTGDTNGVPTSISVSQVDNRRVWVSTNTGKVYRYDLGATQPVITDVSTGLPGRHATQVLAGSDAADTVYVVYSGYDANTPSTPGKVFLSTDAGKSWQNISADLPDVPASAIALDPNDVNRIWIAQDTAVYSTRDRGVSWTSERRNMPIVGILDLEYNANTGFLVVATYGRGIWRMPVDGSGSAKLRIEN